MLLVVSSQVKVKTYFFQNRSEVLSKHCLFALSFVLASAVAQLGLPRWLRL